MTVKMTQLVRWSDDLVATPREMLDRGLAEVRTFGNFKGSRRGPERRATFVCLKGTAPNIHSGVEVSGYVKSSALSS